MSKENNIAPINENLNVVKYDANYIKSLIYTIRGKQVMLDNDVALLYHYETKNINKAMKRNIERFPQDFCFQLTKEELQQMWFQNGTTFEKEYMKYRSEKYRPYVYTEQGISMLAGILKNDIAVKVSINIMRAFVEMRMFISTNRQMFERLTNVEYKLLEHDNKFNQVFDELQRNKKIEFKQKVFFKGQIYDAYEFLIDIIKTAQEKIVIIDNYIDYSILKTLKKKNKNVEVVVLTSNNSSLTKIDIEKFNKQYPILKVGKTDKFHDRFIIIDNKELYHCGASLKDLGKKCFAINKIEETKFIDRLESIVMF